jgi:DNA-binding transcriptional regulator YiaG
MFRIQDISPYLLKIRIALKLTQEELALAVGVTRQTINKHEEHEYQGATPDFIIKVMDAVGLVQRLEVSHLTLEVKEPDMAVA